MRLIALDERARSGQLSQAPMMAGRDGGGLSPVASFLAWGAHYLVSSCWSMNCVRKEFVW